MSSSGPLWRVVLLLRKAAKSGTRMKRKPVISRPAASDDIEQAVAYYVGENAREGALGFVDAVESAYGHLSRHPAWMVAAVGR